MSRLEQTALYLGERLPWPDSLTRAVIASRVSKTGRVLSEPGRMTDGAFAEAMADYPIALHTDTANEQHYELPAAFFEHVLGPQRKYSCCHYDGPDSTLAEAEESALRQTAHHADLADGQTILELGCGWGSLTLWMARHYSNANILAVSNSASQRAFIEEQARCEGLDNLEVRTADMNGFETERRFDRVVSVEMFEHMANWQALLGKARNWCAPGGRLFVHVFTHESAPYRFEVGDTSDWIAQHFFTGGIMPSHGLISAFPDLFELEGEWRWDGEHYARTARGWLKNYDANRDAVADILQEVYGADAKLWERRWRLFFLATEGLFGHRSKAWGVSHYRLAPTGR
ncbi:Cyclopropane-fatty-acyl-phospholipid synthase [Methyloligella halotolerans]|uniref:Cyclopropane-fatty-acyl-phospholipid synthase n=1 Tax=Methyloligella halotolerans TaxID=1177755 RepID=A0A1E2RWW2_9HYPH|nr:cyclopropane-fatty-acyl-phospholipid synthase family protein [Methyloligella halotolerans]ODA66701.1 Cyclopropane-fatty-acyl-phospholipid synthase [Methyloligella halotolerans]